MERTYIKDVTPGICRVQGFVENFRNKKNMAFIVVKDITGKLQVTIVKEEHPEFNEMLDKLTIHSVVSFEGEVVASEYVKMGGKEMYPTSMKIESVAEALPIKDDSDIDVKMDYRWIDLRRDKNHLMLRLQTTLTAAMREFLVERNFVEIHTPKLIAAASESGSDVFEVKYFEPYTLNKSRYILIEFSFNSTTEEDVNAWCDYLISYGLVPIIAHPERYEFVKNDISVIERLSDKGCLFQVNCGSVVGIFGEREANIVLKMLYAGFVDFIGSDAHDLRWRTTDMYAFLRDYPDNLPDGILDDALFTNPQKVINNEEIIQKRLNSLLIY